MTALPFVLAVLALALGTAWVSAAVLLPLWTLVARRFPVFARTAPVAAAVPLLLGASVATAALLPGDPHLDQLFGCHCATSWPGWLHLCPVHPGQAMALLPLSASLLVLLLPGRLFALTRLLREPPGDDGGGEPVLTDLAWPTALLVGWRRPVLAVDRRLWGALGEAEREAVLAHERAHIQRHDPAVLMLLRLLTSVAPGRARAGLLRAWLDRAEACADAGAAEQVGDPLLVAEALLRCARLGRTPDVLAPSWTGGRLERRVADLLSDRSPASSVRADAGFADAAVVACLGVVAVAAAPWLHHQLEHLLNLPL